MSGQSSKKLGRPPSPETLAKRAEQKLLNVDRPSYASSNNAYPAWVTSLCSQEPMKVVRKGLQLNHRMIPDELVYADLAVDEGANEAFAKVTKARIDRCKEAIGRSTKKGGQRIPSSSLRKKLAASVDAVNILDQFELGLLTYKQVARMLTDNRLPVPSERTLRRWRS